LNFGARGQRAAFRDSVTYGLPRSKVVVPGFTADDFTFDGDGIA
jgi:hypothetical protein